MSVDDPYPLDFFSRITNVNFGGGKFIVISCTAEWHQLFEPPVVSPPQPFTLVDIIFPGFAGLNFTGISDTNPIDGQPSPHTVAKSDLTSNVAYGIGQNGTKPTGRSAALVKVFPMRGLFTGSTNKINVRVILTAGTTDAPPSLVQRGVSVANVSVATFKSKTYKVGAVIRLDTSSAMNGIFTSSERQGEKGASLAGPNTPGPLTRVFDFNIDPTTLKVT